MRSSEVLTLESQVGSLQASDLSSGSFSSRYEHANEQFLLLVAEVRIVSHICSGHLCLSCACNHSKFLLDLKRPSFLDFEKPFCNCFF